MGTHPIFESDFDCLTEHTLMAKDRGGNSGGQQGMKAPPVAKYRKNIGTYQRDTTQKTTKKVFRDLADKRKDPNKSTLGDVVTSLTVVILIVALLYAVFFILLPDPGKTST